MCFDFLYNFLVETFLILRKIQRDTIINVHRFSCNVPVMLLRFEINLAFFSRQIFPKKPQISNFVKFRPVGAEMFPVGGQTERDKTHMTKLMVVFTQSC